MGFVRWNAVAIFWVMTGAAIGWVASQVSGLIIGVGGGILLSGIMNLHRRLKSLEDAVEELRSQLPQTTLESQVENRHSSIFTDPLSAGASQKISIDPSGERSYEQPGDLPSHRGLHVYRKSRIWNLIAQYFSGGNLPVKVGIVVLFFGVAFLLKYAAEHNRLPIELRLTGVTLGALVLLILGWRLRARRTHYALVLQGGGIGILYLNIFAALRLYNLIPPELAFGILIVLSFFSSALAIMQDSRSLATFGIAGGFLAPLLTSAGKGSHVVLFSYYALLNACILGIAWFRAWRVLNLIGYIATFVITTVWGFNYYQPKFFWTTEPFLILFFLFYVGVAVLYSMRQPPELKGYVDGTLVFGTPLIAFGLQYALVRSYPFGMAWSAFALGFFYLSLATVLFRRDAAGMRLLAEAALALGIGFGTITVPLAVDGRWTASAWALEGAGMVWIGIRQNRYLARVFGMLLQVGAGLFFLGGSHLSTGHIPILNGFYLGSLVVCLAGFFSSLYFYRHDENIRGWERIAGTVIGMWAVAWWFGAGLEEIDRYVPHSYLTGGILLFVSLSCVALDHLGSTLRWPLLIYLSLGLLPGMYLVMAASIGRAVPHPGFEGGFIGWPVGFGLLYYVLRRHDGRTDLGEILDILHAATLWLVTGLLAWELIWQIGSWVNGARTWGAIVWGLVPALVLLLLSSMRRNSLWPVGKRGKAYIVLGAVPVALFAWLWSLYANLSCSGDPRPLSYLPLINPLDTTVGFVYGAIGVWLPHFLSLLPGGSSRRAWKAIILGGAGSVFLWINAILVRTVHYWGGVSFSGHAMFQSVLLQSVLSISWSFIALITMSISARKKLREAWLAGAGLMGIVVFKLFLIDLSNTGTIERIISFMGVGILLLIIGYLSPIPPKGKREEELVHP